MFIRSPLNWAAAEPNASRPIAPPSSLFALATLDQERQGPNSSSWGPRCGVFRAPGRRSVRDRQGRRLAARAVADVRVRARERLEPRDRAARGDLERRVGRDVGGARRLVREGEGVELAGDRRTAADTAGGAGVQLDRQRAAQRRATRRGDRRRVIRQPVLEGRRRGGVADREALTGARVARAVVVRAVCAAGHVYGPEAPGSDRVRGDRVGVGEGRGRVGEFATAAGLALLKEQVRDEEQAIRRRR